jgi:hypothetical protein
MVEWMKRCKRDETQMAERRTWSTRCGLYRIEESNIKYGRGMNRRGEPTGYPLTYRAMAHLPWGWRIISRHRKRSAAIRAVEYFAEHGRPIPPKKKKRKKVKSDKEYYEKLDNSI